MITQTDIQIRFADVDLLGHVNNVSLQHFFDLGKMDFYRRGLGVEVAPSGCFPITAATQTDYVAQVLLREAIFVETRVEKFGTKSMVLMQHLRSRQTGLEKARSRSVMVAFDFVRQESIAIPSEWRAVVNG